MTELLFFIAAIGAIAGALGVVTLQNPFFSVLALVFHLLSLAALFLLLQAQFVAAAQVVVYAGAVMVLYVFVVAYVGAAEAAHFKTPVGGGQRPLAVEVASYLLLIAAVGAVVLARRRGGIHEEEMRVGAMAFLRPPGTGTMAEAVEGRTGTPAHRELGPPAHAGPPTQAAGDGSAAPAREGAR